MNFLKQNWHKLSLFLITLTTPLIVAYAGTTCDPAGGKICNPVAVSGVNTVSDLIRLILTEAIKIGIPIVALAIIYSGFLFVFARGNSEKLGKAKDTLLYSLIGAAILLGSWAIAQLITSTVTSLGS